MWLLDNSQPLRVCKGASGSEGEGGWGSCRKSLALKLSCYHSFYRPGFLVSNKEFLLLKKFAFDRF